MVLIEVLHQTGELLDGQIGEGEIERGRRPHHDAIFCVAATVGERVDIGERDTIEFGLLDAEAAEPGPHQSDHFAGARIIASNRHHLADARAFGAGTVESLADEHHRALRCLDIEHRSGRGDDRLEETRMKRLDVAAGDDEKICTVARLGERCLRSTWSCRDPKGTEDGGRMSPVMRATFVQSRRVNAD